MTRNETYTAGTFGHSAGGTASSPWTTACGSWKASSERAYGISTANRVSCTATSGQPTSVRGALGCVRNSASAAASFTGWWTAMWRAGRAPEDRCSTAARGPRTEEGRVGEESRYLWGADHLKKKKENAKRDIHGKNKRVAMHRD